MFILGGLVGALVLAAFLAGLAIGISPWHVQEEEPKAEARPVKELPPQTEPNDPPATLTTEDPTPYLAPLPATISPRIQTAINRGVLHLKKRLREKNGEPFTLDKRYLQDASVG